MQTYYQPHQTPIRPVQVPVYDMQQSSYYRPVSQIPLGIQQSEIRQRNQFGSEIRRVTREDPQIDSIIQKYRKTYDQRQAENRMTESGSLGMSMTGNSLNFGKTQPASQMRIGNPMSNHTHSQIEDSIRFTNTNSLIRNPSQAINRPPPPQAVELGRQKNPYLSDEDEFSEFKSEEVQPQQVPLALQMGSQQATGQRYNQIQSAPSTTKSSHEISQIAERVVLPQLGRPQNVSNSVNGLEGCKTTKGQQAGHSSQNDQGAKAVILGVCGLIMLYVVFKLLLR